MSGATGDTQAEPSEPVGSTLEAERLGGRTDRGERTKRIVAAVVTLVVLVVVFVGILPQLGDYSEAWAAITAMSVGQLGVLGVTVVASILIYVFPFQAALKGLRFAPAFMIRQTSFTISNAVPGGGAVGLGVQYGMLAGAGVSGSAASSAIGITGVFNLFATLALPVFGVLALMTVQTPGTTVIIGTIAGVVVLGLMIGFFAAVLRSEVTARRIGGIAERFLDALRRRIRGGQPVDLVDKIIDFRNATVDVVRERWLALTVSNLGQQLSQFAVLAAALRITESGAEVQVPILAAFASFALARLAGFIPITPGGLGTVDAGLTGMLIAVGASSSDALAATLLWRAASWVPQVALGFVTLLIWRARSSRSNKAPPAA